MTPFQKILRAFDNKTGVRLSEDEVALLGKCEELTLRARFDAGYSRWEEVHSGDRLVRFTKLEECFAAELADSPEVRVTGHTPEAAAENLAVVVKYLPNGTPAEKPPETRGQGHGAQPWD